MEIKYCECGKEILIHRVRCDECAEKIRFDKAKKISWVEYVDKGIYDHNTEKYFEHIDDMEEHYEYEELEMPSYIYGCIKVPFTIDIENVVENECNDEHYEDAYQDLVNIDELKKFVDNWCKNQKVVTYYQDSGTIILLD